MLSLVAFPTPYRKYTHTHIYIYIYIYIYTLGHMVRLVALRLVARLGADKSFVSRWWLYNIGPGQRLRGKHAPNQGRLTLLPNMCPHSLG